MTNLQFTLPGQRRGYGLNLIGPNVFEIVSVGSVVIVITVVWFDLVTEKT